jgi:hypothetical protein
LKLTDSAAATFGEILGAWGTGDLSDIIVVVFRQDLEIRSSLMWVAQALMKLRGQWKPIINGLTLTAFDFLVQRAETLSPAFCGWRHPEATRILAEEP